MVASTFFLTSTMEIACLTSIVLDHYADYEIPDEVDGGGLRQSAPEDNPIDTSVIAPLSSQRF